MFSNFKGEAAHQAASVGEAKYEKHEAPLGAARLPCKTGSSECSSASEPRTATVRS